VVFFHGASNMCIPVEFMDVLLSLMYFLSLGIFVYGCISRSFPIKICLYLKRLQQASPLVVVCPGICESLNSNEKEWGHYLTYF